MTAQPQRCRFLKDSADGDFSGVTCYAHGIGDCRKSDNRLYVDPECFGCASHSASSQQRIEQVIGELEKLANEEERLKKESKTNEPWMGHAYANSAYLKAIAILREGAK